MFGNKDKKDKDTQEPKGNINLLPDDLRTKESKVLGDKETKKDIELRAPKYTEKLKEKKTRLPWFSFWRKKDKDKPVVEKEDKKEDKSKDKTKFKLNILKNKKKAELEAAKEEVAKKEIMDSVFGQDHPKKDLPSLDHSLVNKREEKTDVKPEVEDMFSPTEMKSSTAPSNMLEDREEIKKTDPELPDAPIVSQPDPLAEATPPKPEEPVTPALKKSKKKDKQEKSKVKDHDKDDDGLGVNLIPTSLTLKSWKSISKNFILVIIITVIFNALAYGALITWETQIENQTTRVDLEIKNVQSRITKFEALQNNIVEMENQINSVVALLEEHIYWTKFFTLLEKYTLDEVYYEGFSAGVNGNLSLKAHGPEFASAAKQLLLLETEEAQKEFANRVSITQVADSGSAGKVFTIDLVLNSDLFYYDALGQEEGQ